MAKRKSKSAFITVRTDDFNSKSISKLKYPTRSAAQKHIERLKKVDRKANPMTGHYYKYKIIKL